MLIKFILVVLFGASLSIFGVYGIFACLSHTFSENFNYLLSFIWVFISAFIADEVVSDLLGYY